MTTLAIVNVAAGGGRCGRHAPRELEKLTDVTVRETERPGHATELARAGYAEGFRRFIAVGGDGTSHEVVNGLFPGATERVTLGFLPLGTGNSFLRDFGDGSVPQALARLEDGESRPCDLLHVRHREGEFYSINLVSIGFPADVATVTNRRFKWMGTFGYVAGVLASLAQLPRRALPLRADGAEDRGRALMHTFANSKFTGGGMMIAPHALVDDGLLEHVRVGPIGRFALLRTLPRLFDGTYVDHPQARHAAVRRVEFELDGPLDLMVDGEVRRAWPDSIEVVPRALDVLA